LYLYSNVSEKFSPLYLQLQLETLVFFSPHAPYAYAMVFPPLHLACFFLLLFAAAESHEHGFSDGTICGTGLLDHDALDKKKIYELPEDEAGYSTSRKLSAVNNTKEPIRIKILWDLFDGDQFSCASAGATVDPCQGRLEASSCPVVCKDPDVVSPEIKKLARKRLAWASSKLSKLISVNQRTAGIRVDKAALSGSWTAYVDELNAQNQLLNGTDLVIIATLRKHDSDNVAGYAGCIMHDSNNRCILGYFNLCPRKLKPKGQNASNVVELERRTTLHELFHVLGAVKMDHFHPSKSSNINVPSGDNTWQIKYSPELKKDVMHIKLPTVTQLWKEQTSCETSEGPALEDLPRGTGTHWEARQFGPEMMSYGTRSGESYLSDITLAFLADTGHYGVNYDEAGSLVRPSTDGQAGAEISLFGSPPRDATEDELKVNKKRSKGYLRWGREEGCAFFDGLVSAWPSIYQCAENGISGCAPDNRMSADCVHKSYTAKHPAVFDTLGRDTCTAPPTGPKTCRISGSSSVSARPNIPKPYRWLGKTNLGGWNPAMDYAPVSVGVWNCAYTKFSTTDFSEGGMGGVSATDLLSSDTRKSIGAFGGQSICPTCRCLRSDLREASVLFLAKGKLGLCYRTNCATPSDLQIGIEGFYGMYWYDCPSPGGDLNIPGFSGSVECPEPVQFCKQENVSGRFMAVSSPVAEWVIWSTLLILIVTSILCCKFNHSKRKSAIAFLESHHGYGDINRLWKIALGDVHDHEFKEHRNRNVGYVIIKVTSVFQTLFALAILVLGFWSLRPSLLFWSAALHSLGAKGFDAKRIGVPGASLLVYAYSQVLVSLYALVFGCSCFWLPDILASYIGRLSNDILPFSLRGKMIVAGVYFVLLSIISGAGYIGSAIILGSKATSHTNLLVGNLLLLLTGMIGSGLGFSWIGRFGILYDLIAVLPGCFLTLNSILGMHGLLSRNKRTMMVFTTTAIACMLVSFSTGVIIFSFAAQSAGDSVRDNWSEKDVEAASMSIWGTAHNCPGNFRCREALASFVQSRMTMSALFQLVYSIMYFLPTFGGTLLIFREKSTLGSEMVEHFEKHPSKVNFESYQLKVRLSAHPSIADMEWLHSHRVKKRSHDSAVHLQRIFRGYSLRLKHRHKAFNKAVNKIKLINKLDAVWLESHGRRPHSHHSAIQLQKIFRSYNSRQKHRQKAFQRAVKKAKIINKLEVQMANHSGARSGGISSAPHEISLELPNLQRDGTNNAGNDNREEEGAVNVILPFSDVDDDFGR
jgi:hypothetical protein